ncbi:MAG: hypothetical protein IT497_00140 [Ottowia sp.]|nr:hypothetical protein [Ottowia sp.]
MSYHALFTSVSSPLLCQLISRRTLDVDQLAEDDLAYLLLISSGLLDCTSQVTLCGFT